MRPGKIRIDNRLPGIAKEDEPRITPIRCLRCREDFPSRDSILNRICEACKRQNGGLSRRDVTRPTPVPRGLEHIINPSD